MTSPVWAVIVSGLHTSKGTCTAHTRLLVAAHSNTLDSCNIIRLPVLASDRAND